MEEKVIKVLQESTTPLKSGEIADAASLDKKDVDKVIKKLKIDNVIDSPKRCYYAIKK